MTSEHPESLYVFLLDKTKVLLLNSLLFLSTKGWSLQLLKLILLLVRKEMQMHGAGLEVLAVAGPRGL